MRLTTSSLLLLSVGVQQFVYGQSPFYYGDEIPLHADMKELRISGKMEQIGRTGVAAMHAVLLK
jgi:hypothetical protein